MSSIMTVLSILLVVLLCGWEVSSIANHSDSENTTSINECASTPCSQNADCIELSPSGYMCKCKPGFTGDGYTYCSDINECNLVNCSRCDNNDGSFGCHCVDEFYSFWPVGRDQYIYHRYNIKYCGKLLANCTYDTKYPNANHCKCQGNLNDIRTLVSPIPKCITGENDCDKNAECVDQSNGNYSCRCNVGFTGNGFNCSDIDECSSFASPCANCSNTIGSYSCGCEPGFSGEPCMDVDECFEGTHKCHSKAKCTNTIGGYNCTCEEEYYVEGDNGTWCSGCPNNSWTDWIDRYNWYFGYYFGIGEFELISVIKMKYPNANICSNPTNAEAQFGNYQPYWQSGDKVHFSTQGLKCLGSEQPRGWCTNFFVRFCCPAGQDLPTDIIQTPTQKPFDWITNRQILGSIGEFRGVQKCSETQLLVRWKRRANGLMYNYKLFVEDLVANTTKKTSVEVVFDSDPALRFSGLNDESSVCRMSYVFNVSSDFSISAEVIAGRIVGDLVSVATKVLYIYPSKTQKFVFFDAAGAD